MSNEPENNQNNELEQQPPAMEEPMSEEPVSEEPVSEEPVSEEPVSEEPVSEEPVCEEPISEGSASDETVSEGSEADEVSNERPARSYIKYIISAVCTLVVIALIAIAGVFAYKKFADDDDDETDIYLFNENLVCVMKNGKWGYINKSGKMVIYATFEDAYEFSECGIAMVCEKDGDEILYGYINKKGDYVIKPKYSYARSFHDKLKIAAVCDSDGEWGVINSKGERIVKTKYKSVSIYDCGVIVVVDADGMYGLFSAKGEELLKPKYENIGDFGDADTAVITEDGRQGIINKKGEFLVEPDYEKLINFNKNGYGWYYYIGEWGIIGKDGKEITDPEYDEVNEFNENDIAVVGKKNKSGDMKYGIVDRKGEEIVKPKYAYIGYFGDDGLASFKEEKDGKYGFINTKGKIVIDEDFDRVLDFYKGYAYVQEGDDCYFVDKKGNAIKPPRGCKIQGFFTDCGLALICEGEEYDFLYGYMNKKGKLVIDCKYNHADDFAKCGIAIIENKDGKYEFINKNGKAIGDEYIYATPFLNDGYAVVCHVDGDEVKFGIINKQGREIIKAEYDDIKVNGESVLYYGISDIINSDDIDLKGYLMNIVKTSISEEDLKMTYNEFEATLDTYTDDQLKSLIGQVVRS